MQIVRSRIPSAVFCALMLALTLRTGMALAQDGTIPRVDETPEERQKRYERIQDVRNMLWNIYNDDEKKSLVVIPPAYDSIPWLKESLEDLKRLRDPVYAQKGKSDGPIVVDKDDKEEVQAFAQAVAAPTAVPAAPAATKSAEAVPAIATVAPVPLPAETLVPAPALPEAGTTVAAPVEAPSNRAVAAASTEPIAEAAKIAAELPGNAVSTAVASETKVATAVEAGKTEATPLPEPPAVASLPVPITPSLPVVVAPAAAELTPLVQAVPASAAAPAEPAKPIVPAVVQAASQAVVSAPANLVPVSNANSNTGVAVPEYWFKLNRVARSGIYNPLYRDKLKYQKAATLSFEADLESLPKLSLRLGPLFQ